VHLPDTSWQTGLPSEYGEAIGYCLLFTALTLVSWLFGQQVERALYKSREAENQLLHQKKLLSIKLKERTEKLRAAQLKEMQQLYKFAELGQFSTALFHELANHISVLSLDLENLRKEHRVRAVANAKESITHIERLVDEVREQLRQNERSEEFDADNVISHLLIGVGGRYSKAKVGLEFKSRGQEGTSITGDPNRFSQVITILLVNALEATVEKRIQQPASKFAQSVKIEIIGHPKYILITISDWGVGIRKPDRNKVFKPLRGTKESGLGIGLYLAKQIIETHFHGSITLSNSHDPTEFVVKIPKQ